LKVIDFRKTVYELWKEDNNISHILAEIGFKDITNPGMLTTAGRFMTIPKGAKAKGLSLDEVKKELIKRGYEIKE